ncbi:MAG: glycosyltransferase family 2 protein, partial [Caldimicrobium sp.]
MAERLISLVIPMHNEEGNVNLVYTETKRVCEEIKQEKGYDYEILFINDGSTDNTLALLKDIKAKDSKVRILNMDKNRGEAAGLTAGFAHARGHFIFTMDGDGQNDPKYFKELLQKLEEGYKVATGYRLKRKEPLITKRIPSFIANRLIASITGIKVRDNGCSLKGYVAEVPKRYQIPHGFHRFLPAFFGVKNEEVIEIPVLDRKRHWGKSHYGLKRTIEVLRDLITFPFLKNSSFYEKFFKFWSYLHLILAIPFGIWLFLKASTIIFLIGMALLLGFFVSRIIYKNLKRFNLAQVEGVYKVEE